jgi:H+/gluconate symporter-like permease
VPLYAVLLVFIALDGAFIAFTATMGLTLGDSASIYRHYLAGMLTAMLTCFIHVLVLFYLIGTGKDIRDAVEDEPDLKERYVPWTRAQKRCVFPPACFAIALIVVAALMGGEIHSRILAAGGGETFPIRSLTGWWVHLLFVVLAVVTTGYAFTAEVRTVKENRRGILELNAELERRAQGRAGRPAGETG